MLKIVFIKKKQNSLGFTLIELLAVVSIMVILASVFVANISGQRVKRDLKIAQNELVTNIRKTQSYTLSSRLLPNGTPAQYYILKFDLNTPNQYKIQALYETSSSPKLMDVETIKLPGTVKIATTSAANLAIHVARSKAPVIQPIYSNCALLTFSAPYGKVIFNDGCNVTQPNNLPNLLLADDYWSKLINFQNNISCVIDNPPTPSACSASTDSIMTITLTDAQKSMYKNVYINGITGAVTFN